MGRRPGIPALLRDHRRPRLHAVPTLDPGASVGGTVGGAPDWCTYPVAEADGAVTPSPGGWSILGFGRYAGWSLGQLATQDRDYLEWLLRSSGGRQYHAEIETLLGSR